MKILQRAVDQSLAAESWVDICTWTADGSTKILGFQAMGQVAAKYRIRNTTDNVTLAEYQTTPGNLTAYVLSDPDAAETLNDSVKVQVYHEAPEAKTFDAFIFGDT